MSFTQINNRLYRNQLNYNNNESVRLPIVSPQESVS